MQDPDPELIKSRTQIHHASQHYRSRYPKSEKSEDLKRYRFRYDAAFEDTDREFSYRVDMKYLRPAGEKAAVVVHHVRQMFPIQPANSGLLIHKLIIKYEQHLKGDFLDFFFFYTIFIIQHCFICRPSDSTVSEDAGIEPRTVATTGDYGIGYQTL